VRGAVTRSTQIKGKKKKMPKIKTFALATLLVLGLLITPILMLIPAAAAADGWTLVTDARGMKAYPDLREYVWQKNASMPPNGQYDKIGLHRLVKTGITPKGVIFMTNCPMWGTGEQRISNPTDDSWTKYENYSQAIYWANRGFDVYAIDYRTHFVPKTLNASQMSFAANWGLDVWVSDIKEAAEKVKEVSGSKKFFIAGECSGGMAALGYATKYWKEDLRGIILLDPNHLIPGYPIVGRMNETNTFNLTAAINDMNAKGNWTYDPFGTLRPIATYALQNPGGPAVNPTTNQSLTPPINPLTNKTWTNITEWFSYMVQYNFGAVTPTSPAGMYSNLMGGYGNISQVEYCFANSELLPMRLIVESVAMVDWVNCPYLTYDYNDHYNEIGVPVLAFATRLFTNRTGTFRFVNGINNTDFTGIMLKDYGHMDVYFGTYSARDISQPAYDWMYRHIFNLEKATVQGTYRDWTVLLLENRIYLYPPATSSGLPPIQSIGTWDPEYYGKLGWTTIDAAKPYIDMCMTCPYVRWS
jgi:pimeloyl-ACP methyl ester carboxylesterase